MLRHTYVMRVAHALTPRGRLTCLLLYSTSRLLCTLQSVMMIAAGVVSLSLRASEVKQNYRFHDNWSAVCMKTPSISIDKWAPCFSCPGTQTKALNSLSFRQLASIVSFPIEYLQVLFVLSSASLLYSSSVELCIKEHSNPQTKPPQSDRHIPCPQ